MADLPTEPPLSGGRANEDRRGAASPVLYGRKEEVEIIRSLIDRIGEGVGSALIIYGEPGIGKSTLLEFASSLAPDGRMRVLRVCGATSETHLPFAGLQQALAPLLNQVETLPSRQRSALQAAFGLNDDTAAPDVFLVGLAALTLLTASAGHTPIFLIADDVQWLDQPSRDVLAFISRRLSSDPILLLMAARSGVEEVLPYSGVPRRDLSALDAEAAERLLDAEAPDLPSDLRRRFLEDAAGNPLALVELPRGARRSETGEAHWLPLTARLERAFFSRVTDLPTATRTLLLVIAENDSRSLGEALDAAEVLLGERIGLDALAPAVSQMLVDVTTGEVRFRHPLVRSAVHQAASPVMLHAVHAALAGVIDDQSDRRIWHKMASAIGPDDALAEELDAAATRSQRRGALDTAILALENAARLSGTTSSRSERLLRAARFAADLGRSATVDRLVREAELDQPQPHVRARFAWIREISQPLALNDPSRILALIGFAADARDGGANDVALNLLWRAAQRCWWGNVSDTERSEILAAANMLGFASNDAHIVAIAGYTEPLARGNDVLQRLTAHAAAGVADPVTAWILGLAANTVGAFDLGVGLLTEASTALREQGRLGDLARVLFARSFAEVETADWVGALRSSAESIRFGEETGQTIWVAAATIVQAKIAGLRGDFDTAEALAAQAERLVLSPGASFWLAMLQNARGLAALSAGRPAEAYEHMQRIHLPGDPAFNPSLQFYSLADYVEAAVSCGQEKVAAVAIEEVERRSAPQPVPWVRVMLSYGKALLASSSDAETFFQAGLGPVAKNWPYLRGRSLLAYGEWLRRQRRIMDARAPLRTSRDIFDALGALPWSERARRELRAAGEASRPRAGRISDLLTPQELQIAELAARGFSNKEIGARLYLSHRTVGYHLYRIFPKLGITARAELRSALDLPSEIND